MQPIKIDIRFCQWGRRVRIDDADSPCGALAEGHAHVLMTSVDTRQPASTCVELCNKHYDAIAIAVRAGEPLQFLTADADGI